MNHWLCALVVSSAMLAGGCDKKEEAHPTSGPVPPASPIPPPEPAAPAPTTAVPPPGSPAAQMQDVGKALGNALNAGASATGATPCEKAYNGITAMFAQMAKTMPAAVKGKEPPPKEKFVKSCGELPEQLQQCLSVDYAMAHSKECNDAQAKLDPATKAKLQAMMGK